MAQWADHTEEGQEKFLVPSKEQMEYVRINKEYDFVKKRALVSFLTNSRVNVEQHFHGRAQNMLNTIERYEMANLKGLIGEIGDASFEKVQAQLADPTSRAAIDEQFFQSALSGLRKGVMEYENDPLLPILQSEIKTRTAAYSSLSALEEQKLLMLNDSQKKAIVSSDKATKDQYLSAVPKLTNAAIKSQDKFKAYEAAISAAH